MTGDAIIIGLAVAAAIWCAPGMVRDARQTWDRHRRTRAMRQEIRAAVNAALDAGRDETWCFRQASGSNEAMDLTQDAVNRWRRRHPPSREQLRAEAAEWERERADRLRAAVDRLRDHEREDG